MTVGFYSYLRLLDARPYKFEPDEVDYREADTENKCGNCFHLYQRKTDEYAVCEILRDTKTDEDERPINLEYVCHFHTHDGDTMSFIEPDTDDEN